MNDTAKWHWQSIAMILERLIKLIGGVLVSVAMARYLGPEKLGLLVFSQSIIMILVVFSAAGTDVMAVKWFLSKAYNENALLLSIMAVRLGLATMLQTALLIWLFFYCGDEINTVAVLGVVIFFSSFDSVHKLYESKGKGYVPSIARLLGFVVASCLKLVFVYFEMKFECFLYAIIVESFITFSFMLWLYFKGIRLRQFKVLSIAKIGGIIRQSSPLLFSAVVALAYNTCGIFIIKILMGDSSVGIYSVATRLSDAWFSLLSVAVISIAPRIMITIESNKNEDEVNNKAKKLYGFSAYACIVVSLFVMAVANWFIPFLFGDIYAEASIILMLHVWSSIFVVWRQISGQVLIAKNLISQHVRRFVLGLLCNIGLCFLLIPLWGLLGAAVAALVSHMLVGYAADLFHPDMRKHFLLKTSSLNIKFLMYG